jgi:hypothetical protein
MERRCPFTKTNDENRRRNRRGEFPLLRRSMSKIMKAIFFSDVDGTLLDDNIY